MKKYLFLVATLLLTVSMSVSAQNNTGRGNAENRRTDRVMTATPKQRAELMTKELGLTAEQSKQVQALIEKQDAERLEQIKKQREERGTGAANRDVSREDFRKMREKEMEAQNEALAKIIGKEKVEKWNELRKTTRESNREGRRDSQGQRGSQRRNN